MEEKQSIRKEIYQIRQETDIRKIKIDSHLVCDQILHLDVFLNAPALYAYMELEKEVAMKELIEAAWQAGKVVAVPKVEGSDLQFYEITSFDQVQEGYFGVREPIKGLKRASQERAPMIIPGVAFDEQRHRLGYGKGFYDRYLKRYKRHTTIAVGFDFQIVERVPQDVFDVVPQSLITPSRQYGCV